MADSPSLTAAGLTFRVTALRMLIPWQGVWSADAELDPDDVTTVPTSGAAALSLFGGPPMTCAIDARFGGTWVARAALRLQGGAGGWDNTVAPQHFHSDGSIPSTQVYQQTAALVGETVADPTPVSFGGDFVRSLGPASRVFLDRQWYLDPTTAITTVATWPSATADADLTLIDFDPVQLRATFQGAALLLPGTVLNDSRFNGASYTVRDVEIGVTRNGSHTTAWLSAAPVSRLSSALTQMVRELGRTVFLASYRYRFVLAEAADYSTIALQAITPGAPDLNPVRQWTGLSGLLAKIPPGLEIVVGFTADSPPVPFIISYSNLGTPLEVDIAGGGDFLVKAIPYAGLLTALGAVAAALSTAASFGNVQAAGSALASALAALPPPSTVLTKAT